MEDQERAVRILESLPLGLIVFSARGLVEYVSPWLIERIGRGGEPGEDSAEAWPEVRELAREALESGREPEAAGANLGGSPFRVETALIREKGEVSGCVCCLTPIRTDLPEPYLFYQTLQSQELNAIFELSSDGILLCDGNGVIVKINEASQRLNGWSAREVVGRNVRDLIEDRMIDKSATLKVLRTQRTVNIMQFIPRTQKHLLVTGTPLFDKEGRIKLVVVNERDITQLNAIKAQLEETQEVSEKYRENLAELALLESREVPIKAESPVMNQVMQYAIKLARLDASNILVTGESGAGKGLLAKFIHDQGQRHGRPFIQINCAAMPEGLLEAELFGYEKGAFTGAGAQGKAGLFELAHTGTLFLDEIGDCPPSIQAKLLKYLDDQEVLRLGSVKPRIIDCSIIAATNRDLPKLIKARAFRSDLYFRLSTFTIHIPPLRERPEDTFELIMHFIDEFNSRYGFSKKISSDALRRLTRYDYPGNVRELRNIIKQAVVMSETDVLDEVVLEGLKAVRIDELRPGPEAESKGSLKDQMDRFEKDLLRRSLARVGNTRELARLLGTSQPTVVRRLQKHGLKPPSKHK